MKIKAFSRDLTEFWRVSPQVTVKDAKGSKPEDEPPPMWFRSYMEKVNFDFFTWDCALGI